MRPRRRLRRKCRRRAPRRARQHLRLLPIVPASTPEPDGKAFAAATASLRPISNHRIEIRTTPTRGRGVFARVAIAPGTVIEAAPALIIPAADCPVLDRTVIHDYYFHWDGDPEGSGRGAVGLGLVTLCNHGSRANAKVERNFALHTLDLIATSPIAPGEEVTIDYACTLWFEPRD